MTLNKDERELLKRASERLDLEIQVSGEVPVDVDDRELPPGLQSRLEDIKKAVLALDREAVQELLSPQDAFCEGLNRGEDVNDPAVKELLEAARKNVLKRLQGNGGDNDQPGGKRKGSRGTG